MPTLYKRPSNGRYYFDAQVNGEQIRISLRTKDYAVALPRFKELEARHTLNILNLPTKKYIPTLQELFDEYLPFCKDHRSARTYRDAEMQIRLFLGPALGHIRTMDLSEEHIEAFTGQMLKTVWDKATGRTYDPRTINLRLETLRKVLRRAVGRRIPAMPCKITLLKVPERLPRYVTWPKFRSWIRLLPPHARIRAWVSVSTGISDRDLGRILWSDVDLEFWTISYGSRGRLKTGRTIVVPLNRIGRRMVRLLFRAEAKKSPSERSPYLFDGVASVQRAYRTASEHSGIKIRPHMLRHTFATRLISKGASLKHVQDLLGHADPSTTQKYATVLPEYLRAAVELLDRKKNKIDKHNGL